MPTLLHAGAVSQSSQMTQNHPIIMIVVLVLLIVILVLDFRWMRASQKLAKELALPMGQWMRYVKSLPFDPFVDIVIVGSLLWKDLVQNWEHMVVAVIGAVIGLWVGHFRYKIQYVRAVPEHHSIVFVRSKSEYVALVILVLVRLAAEQHQIPVTGPLTLLITLLLGVVVFESIGRAWFSYRRYTKDAAGATTEATVAS